MQVKPNKSATQIRIVQKREGSKEREEEDRDKKEQIKRWGRQERRCIEQYWA